MGTLRVAIFSDFRRVESGGTWAVGKIARKGDRLQRMRKRALFILREGSVTLRTTLKGDGRKIQSETEHPLLGMDGFKSRWQWHLLWESIIADELEIPITIYHRLIAMYSQLQDVSRIACSSKGKLLFSCCFCYDMHFLKNTFRTPYARAFTRKLFFYAWKLFLRVTYFFLRVTTFTRKRTRWAEFTRIREAKG